MGWLARLFWAVAAIVAFLFAALAVNQEAIALKFMVWQSPELSVFWWLLLAFGLGLALGLLGTAWATARLKLRNRRLNKQLNEAQAALGRSGPVGSGR